MIVTIRISGRIVNLMAGFANLACLSTRAPCPGQRRGLRRDHTSAERSARSKSPEAQQIAAVRKAGQHRHWVAWRKLIRAGSGKSQN